VEYKIEVYGWAVNTSNIKSDLISVNIRSSNGTLITFKDLTIPINITFNLDIDQLTSYELTNIRCMSYNGSKFVAEGTSILNIDLKNSIGICSTIHLTDFVLMIPEEGNYIFDVYHPDPIPPYIVNDKYKIYKSSLFWFTISLSLIFCYLLLWGYCKEKSEAEFLLLLKDRQHISLEKIIQSGKIQNNSESDIKLLQEAFSMENTFHKDNSEVMEEDKKEAKEEDKKEFKEEEDKKSMPVVINEDEKSAEEYKEIYDLVAVPINNPLATAGRQKNFKKIKRYFRRKIATHREPGESTERKEEMKHTEPEVRNKQIMKEQIPTQKLTTNDIPELFFVLTNI
jgi:hypothetical protein